MNICGKPLSFLPQLLACEEPRLLPAVVTVASLLKVGSWIPEVLSSLSLIFPVLLPRCRSPSSWLSLHCGNSLVLCGHSQLLAPGNPVSPGRRSHFLQPLPFLCTVCVCARAHEHRHACMHKHGVLVERSKL